jgi:hypothetical protein
VKSGQKVRKDTKTHQDRWIALDETSCALISEILETVNELLAPVGLELAKDAYLSSNDPTHATPWKPGLGIPSGQRPSRRGRERPQHQEAAALHR